MADSILGSQLVTGSDNIAFGDLTSGHKKTCAYPLIQGPPLRVGAGLRLAAIVPSLCRRTGTVKARAI